MPVVKKIITRTCNINTNKVNSDFHNMIYGILCDTADYLVDLNIGFSVFSNEKAQIWSNIIPSSYDRIILKHTSGFYIGLSTLSNGVSGTSASNYTLLYIGNNSNIFDVYKWRIELNTGLVPSYLHRRIGIGVIYKNSSNLIVKFYNYNQPVTGVGYSFIIAEVESVEGNTVTALTGINGDWIYDSDLKVIGCFRTPHIFSTPDISVSEGYAYMRNRHISSNGGSAADALLNIWTKYIFEVAAANIVAGKIYSIDGGQYVALSGHHLMLV